MNRKALRAYFGLNFFIEDSPGRHNEQDEDPEWHKTEAEASEGNHGR